jgi:hypothetical protein
VPPENHFLARRSFKSHGSHRQEAKSGKHIFTINIQNNAKQDFNIDPDEIYYITTAFDTALVGRNYKVEQSRAQRAHF